jgi:hypothetical protein
MYYEIGVNRQIRAQKQERITSLNGNLGSKTHHYKGKLHASVAGRLPSGDAFGRRDGHQNLQIVVHLTVGNERS